MVALLVTGCGSTSEKTVTNPTIRPTPVARWAATSLPSLPKVQSAMDSLLASTQALNLGAVKNAAGSLAHGLRQLRIDLEAAGPPPLAAAIVGPALVNAASRLEEATSAVASCVGESDCTPKLYSAQSATVEWNTALKDFNKVLETERG